MSLALVGRWFRPGAVENDGRTRWMAAIICGLSATGIALMHLFVPGPVGVADQGDGQQLLCQLGVGNSAPFDYVTFTQHIYPSWLPHQWYGEACGVLGSGEQYYSSQLVLLWLAKWATPFLGWGHGIDTRALGMICAALLGVFIALLVTQLPGRTGFRVLVAALVTAVVSDGVFLDFFVSPYSEAAAFLGTIATIIAVLFLWRTGRTTWPGIGCVTVAGAFTITAETSMVVLLPVLAVALLWLPHSRRSSRRHARARHRSPRTRLAAAVRGARRRLPALAAVVLLTGIAVAYVQAQPKRLAEVNAYNAVFLEMLPYSGNPGSDLAWLGQDQSLAHSSGASMSAPNAAVHHPAYEHFQDTVSQASIVRFYLAHPARLVPMVDRGLDAIARPQLDYLGSYPADSGAEPWQKEHRFPLVEGISAVFAAVPLAIVLLHLVTLILGIAVAARRRLGTRANAFGRVTVFMVAALWAHFWAVTLSGRTVEISRHMLNATFLTALSLAWIAPLMILLRRRDNTTRDTPNTAVATPAFTEVVTGDK